MICVVVGRTRHKMMQTEIQEAAKRGAEMIELRLDFLAKAPDFKRLLTDKPCAMVATVRRQEDGGRWTGSEEERQILLRQATVAGFDWIDIETDVADKIQRFKGVKRIVSYHNMREVPEDLATIHESMCAQDADVVKLAVTAQQPADNLRVLALLQNSPKPTIALCMGDLGLPSRVLGAKYGAPFTYAAFNRERGVAPGIPSFDQLKNLYHYDQINAETKVFGLIGDPVAHSLSPAIHNAAFRDIGFNGVYLPFRVPRGHLIPFLKEFDRFPILGYSVTIPHKEAALTAAKRKENAVVWIQAANTLVRHKDGFTAYNTDLQSARESLQVNLPTATPNQPAKLEDLGVMILGAGGVARAVAFALQKEKARVVIANRNPERAKKLAADVGCRWTVWEARHAEICELLVNCTSVGMHPNMDESPIHASFLKPGLSVFDTVYNPETTLLIKEARVRGCRVVTGVDMFVRQAAMQFRLFTGQDAPLEVMYDEVKRALSPLNMHSEP